VRGITDLAHKGAPVDFLKEVTQVMRNIALCLVDQGEK
jgi:protein gp37